jgi:Protein of unknown function (DUF3347)
MTHLVSALMVAFGLTLPSAAPADTLPESIIEPYLSIHAALTADKIDGIKKDAQSIAAAAKELENGDRIAEPARELSEAANIKAARKAFGTLSEELVKRVGQSSEQLKIAFCPMAQKPWLQKSTQIRNPYYGSEMLTCGELKK